MRKQKIDGVYSKTLVADSLRALFSAAAVPREE